MNRSQRSQQTALEGGGILIGKTYSMLTPNHKSDTTQHLTFFTGSASVTNLPQESATECS